LEIDIQSDNPDIVITPSSLFIRVGELQGSFIIGCPQNISEGSFSLTFDIIELSPKIKYEQIEDI